MGVIGPNIAGGGGGHPRCMAVIPFDLREILESVEKAEAIAKEATGQE